MSKQRKIEFLVNRQLDGGLTYLRGQRDSFDLDVCEREVDLGYAEYVSAPPEGSVALQDEGSTDPEREPARQQAPAKANAGAPKK